MTAIGIVPFFSNVFVCFVMRWFYRFFCKDNICGAENIHNLNEKGFTPEWSGRRSLSAFV